jgi:hypothetical protein
MFDAALAGVVVDDASGFFVLAGGGAVGRAGDAAFTFLPLHGRYQRLLGDGRSKEFGSLRGQRQCQSAHFRGTRT